MFLRYVEGRKLKEGRERRLRERRAEGGSWSVRGVERGLRGRDGKRRVTKGTRGINLDSRKKQPSRIRKVMRTTPRIRDYCIRKVTSWILFIPMIP
jgi:hypothetical protein